VTEIPRWPVERGLEQYTDLLTQRQIDLARRHLMPDRDLAEGLMSLPARCEAGDG
jgi:hypothetical protein